MEPQNFSFTKRPIDTSNLNAKRQSVISAILPNSATSNNSDDKLSSNSTHKSSRGFLSDGKKNLVDAEFRSDDPLTDYNEQIRAPKVRSHKSVGDIGSILKSNEDNKNNDFTTKVADLTTIMKNTTHFKNSHSERKLYQPATADISRSTSFDKEMTPSTSVGDEVYNIENYLKTSISNNQLISNLDPLATHKPSITTSVLSSKKNSNDSITSSKKQPRFTMIPIRPIEEPKTPNYVPCVLRATIQSGQSQQDYNQYPASSTTGSDLTDPDSSNLDDSNLSKDHWKPNNSTSKCADCSTFFTILNRRHHCRKCGEIFCGDCLIAKAKLNYKSCDFEMNGILTKVCFDCGKLWSDYLVENFKKFNDMDDIAFPNFKKNLNLKKDGAADDHELANPGLDKKTVPADWAWSSF